MPAAIAVPIGLAVAGMISQNVQNKAAAQQNTNQQNAAVGNAQNAYKTANANLQSYMGANPAPFGGNMSLSRPSAYGATGVPMAPPQAPSQTASTAPTQHQMTPQPGINPMALRALVAALSRPGQMG